MKYSVRLAIAFFILSTLPVAFVSYVSTVNTERSIKNEIEIHLGAITEIRAADFDRWVRSLCQLIESVAQRPLVVDLTSALVAQANQEAPPDPAVSSELLGSHLLPHLRAEGLYTVLSVVDASSGRVLVSTAAEEIGKFRIGEPFYEEGLAETYIGSVSYTPAQETLTMHVGTPIGRSGESVIAVLVGRVNLNVLGDIVTCASGKHRTEDVYLVDAFGFFVTEPRFGGGYALRRVVDSEGVRRALAGETDVARYVDYRGVRVFGAFRPLSEYRMALLAEIDEAEALAPVVKTRVLAWALVAGAIVAFSVLGLVLARRMTYPLRRIAEGAARIGRGEFGHRIGMTRADEFGNLSRAFDKMAENLQAITASRDDLRREMAGRLEAEEALRESERRFREMSELLPEAVCECDVSGRITFANRAVLKWFGYTEEDLAEGVDTLELIVPKERERAAENLRRILDGAEIGGRELTAVTKGGETFPVIVHSVAAWRGEEIVGVRAVIVDISEQKRAREALETAEEIVSAIPTGILIYRFEEPDRLVLVAGNETAATFVDAERSAGEELKTHWPARMVERLRPSLVEVVRDGGIYDREAVVGPPEARRAFHMRAFRIPGNRIVLAFEEITERVRAEEALKAEEEKYRLLFENMMNGFALHEIVLDEAGTPVDYVFLEVNAAFERMVGLRREELVGERVTEVIPGIEADTADWIGRYGKVALTGEETRFEQYAELLGRWYSVLAFSPRPGQFATIFEDVTEERLAAERIEESERRYRAIVELAPVGIVTVNLDGTVASCNEEFAQIAGYESDEMVGRHFSKLPPVRARDIPRYVRIFAAILRGRRPEPFEATWTMKDGTVRHGEVHVALLRREDRTWGIQVIVQDITHRKEAEDELRASEAKFRDLVEELHEALFTVDEHGIVTYVSPSIERITGYAPSELIGKPYSAITLEEDVRTVEEMREILARAPEPRGEDYRVVAKDGTVRWTRMSPRPIFEGDRFAGIRGLVIDVTEEKLAGEALKVSERRYQSLFENAALGIYQTTPDGRILAANPSLVRMLGYDSFEDLATRNLEQNGYESETPRERFKERIEREGRIEGMESVWVRKDGERLFVRENAVAVRDDEGSVVFYEGTVEDITAQRRAEAERRAMEAQLRQSQKLESIGTLASGVAHEINNPITGIINYAHLVHDRTSDVSLKRFAEGIAREGERVAEIVRNLLSFSRHEKESHSPARICDIVEQTLSLVTAVLRKDQIHVDVDVPADLPDIRCRSQQIQQVLMNLLTNARDALNARYPKLDEDKIVRIVARSVSESGKEWIRLTVEDHGAGIPEEIVERIFDPFFTTKPKDKGTGLGLSISHGIIRDHGGSLSIESKPGVYTRFIVKLPIDNGWRLTDEGTSE